MNPAIMGSRSFEKNIVDGLLVKKGKEGEGRGGKEGSG